MLPWTNIKRWVLGAFAAISVLYVVLLRGKVSKAKLELETEHRKAAEKAATSAAKQTQIIMDANNAREKAREKGDQHVKSSVEKAKTGDRDHFNSGY